MSLPSPFKEKPMNEQIEQKNTTMRAVIYARVSTEEQAKHNFSLESQVELARKWVVDHKFELACEPFVDAGESAKTMNRKALARLLEYCRTHKGRVDAVLIYKIDRIARNMADHVAIRSLLSQYGVRIYSVTEPIGGDNSTSKLLENVMASFAQFDNDAKSGRLTNHPKRALNPDFPLRVTARCACGGRFTGSWSRGQMGGRYAYYHCAKCHQKSVKKEVFEEQFMEFLTQLAPKKEEMGMFRASIIDCWQGKHNELNTDIATIDRNIEKVEEEKVRVVDLTKQGVFDADTAKEELNRIKEKVTLLRLSRNELQIEEFDVEASVNYCLYFMVNVYKLWYEVKLTDKIKFQEMIFPEGVLYDYSTFGTTKTADIYTLKQLIDTPNSTMVQYS